VANFTHLSCFLFSIHSIENINSMRSGFVGFFPQYVSQAGHKLEILLRQHPECWDYRCVSPLWLIFS
jgi:hypothetical protein